MLYENHKDSTTSTVHNAIDLKCTEGVVLVKVDEYL